MRAATSTLLFLIALLLPGQVVAQCPEPVTPGPDWRGTLDFPNDAFVKWGYYDQPSWVKFAIRLCEPGEVLFQDGHVHPFHHDFGTASMDPYLGISRQDWDALTLNEAGQEVVLGAVLYPPRRGGFHTIDELAIQFIRRDAYPREQLRDLFSTVRDAITMEPATTAYYFPTPDQRTAAETDRAWFEEQGIPVDSTGRWSLGDACYARGWALGRLRHVDHTRIDEAYLSGELLSTDVLLTDDVPAEIPRVAGVVSLSPSTPSSHVAILAHNFGIPFVHLVSESDRAAALALADRLVVLKAEQGQQSCVVRLVDAQDQLSEQQHEELLALKQVPVLDISPMGSPGRYSASTDGLVPDDIRHYGGKAANFGSLRRALPDNSPVSLAFSFDLWNAFLDQTLPGGAVLRDELNARLAPYTYPPDLAALSAELDAIRDLIKDETTFSPVLQAAIESALQDPAYGFDPSRRLRFRSSTNMEDSDDFTGAGLYDSKSGCLADELDGDELGPSLCDADEPNEKGVYRAIRKVFASFYNDNAFLERLRHGIDESTVGMALLVHHSFPDEIELANGVATYTPGSVSYDLIELVSQVGATSVTNPEPGTIPEEVRVDHLGPGSTWPTMIRESSLVQLGGSVLDWLDEYIELTEYLLLAAEERALHTGAPEAILEFEYKKLAPGGDLIIKQVRRVPGPSADLEPAFLLNAPTRYCLMQGESGAIFGNHRLKSRWQMETRNTWLDETTTSTSLFTRSDVEYVESCLLLEEEGAPPLWPDATYSFESMASTDRWTFPELQEPRHHELTVAQVPFEVQSTRSPIRLLRELGDGFANYTDDGCLRFTVTYDNPLPAWTWMGPGETTVDYGMLCPCREDSFDDSIQTRQGSDGLADIVTRFRWPAPVDVAAGYTAPLVRFEETVIQGLTTEPLVLTSYWSQTYRPEHHNFSEHFLFEPALEPGVTEEQLAELEARDIRIIHFFFGGDGIAYYSDEDWRLECLSCLGPDADGDGRCFGQPTYDCDDENGNVWSTPSEVMELRLATDGTVTWQAPLEPGALTIDFELLRARAPSDLAADLSCLNPAIPGDTTLVDGDLPGSGQAFYYLARARNACPEGAGDLGRDSTGLTREAVACP